MNLPAIPEQSNTLTPDMLHALREIRRSSLQTVRWVDKLTAQYSQPKEAERKERGSE